MPRPKSKSELLILSNKNYEKLKGYVTTQSTEDQSKEFPEDTLNRNIRDVLAHLHHWHVMFLSWYSVGMTGNKPPMPAEGYTWKETSKLNVWLQKRYSSVSLHEIKLSLDDSFNEIQNIINNHSDIELFEKKRYIWTGSTSLGAYMISATSSHYDWALKLIKKSLKK